MSGFRDAGLQRPLNRRLGEVLGGVGVSTMGNTAGTTGTVFGPVALVGVGGVSLSQSTRGNRATISISASAEAGVAIGAGTQTQATGTVIFSNSPTVTFGLSNGTLTASASQAPSMAISAAGSSIAAGTVVFSNANNVTFGMNGSTVTASATFAGGGVALAAGTQTGSTGTISFADSNGLTFGMSGSTRITGSHNAVSRLAVQDSAGVNVNLGQGELRFATSVGANVTFGKSVNGATWIVTASVAWPQISFWDASGLGSLDAVSAQVTRCLIQRINIPNQIAATRAQLIMAVSNSNNAGGTVAFSFGVYTMSGSTASIASSASRTWAYNSTLAGSSYADVQGTNYRSMTLGTWNLTPGDYLFAVQFRVTTALTSGSYNWIGGHDVSIDGFDYVTGPPDYFNHGKLSFSTAAFPATIQPSQIKGAAFDDAPFFPYFQLVGTF